MWTETEGGGSSKEEQRGTTEPAPRNNSACLGYQPTLPHPSTPPELPNSQIEASLHLISFIILLPSPSPPTPPPSPVNSLSIIFLEHRGKRPGSLTSYLDLSSIALSRAAESIWPLEQVDHQLILLSGEEHELMSSCLPPT